METTGARIWFALAAGVAACLTAYLAVAQPLMAFGLVAAVLGVVLLQSSAGRLTFVVAGGLVVLQSESTGQKLAYMAGVGVCLVIAAVRVPRLMKQRVDLEAFRPVLRAGVGVLAMCLVSAPIAISHGVDPLTWFRSVLPYLLLAVLPLVGLDVAVDASIVTVRRIVVTVGLIAPLAFLTDWLDRRGVSALPIGRFAFASIPLCATMLGYALGRLADKRRLFLWGIAVAYVPVAVLLTGTRSGLALLGGFAGSIGSRSKKRIPPVKAVPIMAAIAAVAVFLVPRLGARLTNDPLFYANRFSSLGDVLGGRAFNTDQSLIGRAYQTHVAMQVFKEHTFFGIGPGLSATGVQTFDTPAAPLAYFGLMGVLALGAYVAAFILTCHRLRVAGGYTRELTAARVFVVSMVCYLPLSSVFDDKGLALAAVLFTALLATSTRETLAVVEADTDAGSQAMTARLMTA